MAREFKDCTKQQSSPFREDFQALDTNKSEQLCQDLI